jgi:hypothetical protein
MIVANKIKDIIALSPSKMTSILAYSSVNGVNIISCEFVGMNLKTDFVYSVKYNKNESGMVTVMYSNLVKEFIAKIDKKDN